MITFFTTSWWPALLVFVLLAGTGCSNNQATAQTEPLARVDSLSIPADWFQRTYVDLLLRTGQNDTPAARRKHLESLIDAFLLGADAEAVGIDTSASYQRFLQTERKLSLGGRLLERVLQDSALQATDAELRETYVRWNEPLVIRQLFFRDPASAEAAYQRLERGASFIGEAMRLYETSDSTAGLIGEVRYSMMDQSLADAAYPLGAGEYSHPVRTREGFHIVRVEDRMISPLLTETGYETRRTGLRQELEGRRWNQAGDRYVRAFMSDLDVQVQSSAIQALAMAIERASEDVEPTAAPSISQDELIYIDPDAFTEALTPETVLMTYRYQGEQRAFTANDYRLWLDRLPPTEARRNAAASAGRALRNEVLALEAERRNLGDDTLAANLRREALLQLAKQYRTHLRSLPPQDPPAGYVEAARSIAGVDDRARIVADFWLLPFPTRDAAEDAKAQIEAGTDPATFPNLRTATQTDITTEQGPASFVRNAPLGEPLLINAGRDQWGVLYVSRRDRIAVPLTEDEEREFKAAIAPFAREFNLLQRLRARATVQIDTTQFRELYEASL
ncbi:MAG: peptidyl-prolyl cis-trans isomerase [Bacteroidota bacterium]